MAGNGSQHRKPGFKTAVEDVKALATKLAMDAEAVLGRRTARVLGVVALFAVAFALLFGFLNWYISPDTAQERQGLTNVVAISLGGVAAIIGLYFTRQALVTTGAHEAARGRDAALRACLEQLGRLLRDKDWSIKDKKGVKDNLPRRLARAEVLSVLGTLDGPRKRILVRFLYESNLLKRNIEEFDLQTADLREADLHNSILPAIFLSGVRLGGANLSGATLDGSDLSDSDLSGVTGITNEQLKQVAGSIEGAIMPDGSKHP